jgi:hypothetical protein
MNNINTIKEALGQELVSLRNARDILQYSYEKCVQIGIKNDYNYEELESFEALTSRFARLSDLIIQKSSKKYSDFLKRWILRNVVRYGTGSTEQRERELLGAQMISFRPAF